MSMMGLLKWLTPPRKKSLPVVGDVDSRLLALITDKLHLVFSRQDRHGLSLLTGSVPDAHLNGTGVSLLPIDVAVLVKQSVAAMTLDGVGPIEHALTPALLTTVQGIGAIVLRELALFTVQAVNEAVLDTVGDTTDGGAVVRGVVLLIVVLSGEAQDDILTADAELLDDGTQGQEGEFGLFGGGHGCDLGENSWSRGVESGMGI